MNYSIKKLFVLFIFSCPYSLLSQPYPSDILHDIQSWKITLPVDKDGKDSRDAGTVEKRNTNVLEVSGKNLVQFDYSPYFSASESTVVFRAHCAGATTKGTKYPRSELRQLVDGGDNYWSMNDSQYFQTILAVNHVPVEKPEVCMVQIHGPVDEPLRVQYHADIGVYLVWNENNKNRDKALKYSIGEKLKISVGVNQGNITCLLENLNRNTLYSSTWQAIDTKGYFKVGCYTLSSIFLSQFKLNKNNEPLDAYGEVVVYYIALQELKSSLKRKNSLNIKKGKFINKKRVSLYIHSEFQYVYEPFMNLLGQIIPQIPANNAIRRITKNQSVSAGFYLVKHGN